MGPQAISTGVYSLLLLETVGLVLGRSSLTVKGFQVLPGVIDEDFTGEIRVLVQASSIVQVLPDPDCSAHFASL